MSDNIEGKYAEWQWCPIWKSYLHEVPYRIYPGADGKFTVSSNGVWHEGVFDTFEEAERDALGVGGAE